MFKKQIFQVVIMVAIALSSKSQTLRQHKGGIGASFSYSPWLRHLASGMSISLLTGYYRLNEHNTVSASLRYFSIGNIVKFGIQVNFSKIR